MSLANCRLLPFRTADGPHNMAADEVLLESAQAGIASLRLYGWVEATVSLGYFQPERLRQTDARVAALPFVRRPSGGAALVHHHEVTYALGLPAGPPWQTVDSWLCRMHHILTAALASLGVDTAACGGPGAGRFAGLLCFQHITPGDLLIGSAKVVGSAQRRHRGALMQHGSVLLATSPYAPVLAGIDALSGTRLSAAETCRAIATHFARATGWDLAAVDWTPEERRRIEELVRDKFGQDAWNRKR
jgi:lipoyl(octanoyl) transferase